jgi:hypothetical protein
MEYEIRVEACTFVCLLLHLWLRVLHLVQLFCLFQCGNAQNTMNMNVIWYVRENK